MFKTFRATLPTLQPARINRGRLQPAVVLIGGQCRHSR